MKPIDKSKRSNKRCINCKHYKNRLPNPTYNGRPGWYTDAEDICPTANNKPINYWNCCSQFTWDPDKQYTDAK